MASRIAVVVSQGQSHNPAKRGLEEDLVAALLFEHGVDVTVIPNLYDLSQDSTGMLALQGIKGTFILLTWLYPRAAHWILDRNGIRGHFGQTLLVSGEDDDDDDEDDGEDEEEAKNRVADEFDMPNRKIYCLDLRSNNAAQPYIDEIKRIFAENRTQVVDLLGWIGGGGTVKPEPMRRFQQPTNDTALGGNGSASHAVPSKPAVAELKPPDGNGSSLPLAPAQLQRIEDTGARRWYPVIDYSRCTNCMECIDFCLFGVYGVDRAETILVEQPDNCRKGCPACSRVCPENAIIFPQHKTPAIAGAEVTIGGLKIDLSQLFGAPDGTANAVEIAARERDEQLVLAGRDAVGLEVGIPKRQEGKPKPAHDKLDSLLDELDQMDL